MAGKSFYTFALAFFAGVFLCSLVHVHWAIFCAAAVGVAVARLCGVRGIVLGAAIAVCVGAGRAELSRVGAHPLDAFVGGPSSGKSSEKAVLSGFVCDEPQVKDLSQKFCFSSDEPDDNGDRVMVTAARYPARRYGDALRLTGKLEFPQNFAATDGGPDFDYVSYLAKDGFRYVMTRPSIQSTGERKGNIIIAALYRLKGAFVNEMRDLFPEPESSLLAGVLLGDKSSLPQDISDEFRNAGLVHILVLSGSNVTIVAEGLMKAFSFLPRALGQGLGALSIVLFALMTGAGATTVRASIMALTAIVARSSARRYDVTRALTVAAFGMVLQNPRILVFDASFQLSLLSTLALIYVAPIVEDRLSFLTERFGLREMVATTLGTQLFTTPLTLYMMGRLSVIALIPNLLVLPFVPMSMLGGFVAVVLGFVLRFAALPVAWATTIILSYMLKTTAFFGDLPFAAVHMRTSAIALVLSYTAIVAFLIRSWRRKNSPPPSAS
jgi:competence protein ComEC